MGLPGRTLIVGGIAWLISGVGGYGEETDAVSGATRPGQSVIGSVTSDYKLLDNPQPRTAELGGDAVFTLVRWSNNLSYGLANVASPGTEYLVLVPTVRADAVTDVRVLRGVILLCREIFQQPSVTIGIPEGGQIPADYEALVDELSSGLELQIATLGDEPSRSLPTEIALTRAACELPESLAMADAVILVPAVWRDEGGKVHGALDAVAALNPGGAASDSVRVDLASAVAPLYVFADVLRPRIGGKVKPLNAVLASDDLCAVDATGARLLGAVPADVPGLLLAEAHEVGKVAWIDINLNGVPVPHVKKKK